MPLPTDIDVLLRQIASSSVVSAQIAKTSGKAYELWIALSIVNALRLAGWTVQIRTYQGHRTRIFVQRGSPGRIQPRIAIPPNAGYFYLERADGRQFELHNSVVFEGRSAASHEYDICVITRRIGRRLRNAQTADVATGHPVFLVECKEYLNAVGIAGPRSVMASTFDGTRWAKNALRYENSSEGRSLRNHRTLAGRLGSSFVGIVSPAGFSGGAIQLATRYNIRLYDDVDIGTWGLHHFLAQAVHWLNRYRP